jgi:hypothetical protein
MKKVAIIILVAVLTLGVLGTAYAAWGTDLHIGGTVNTGSYMVTITGTGSPVSAASYSFITVTPAATTPAGAGPLTVQIADAVPGTYTIPFVVTNTSSIPVSVTLGSITKVGPTGDLTAAQMTVSVGSFVTTSLAAGNVTPTTVSGTLTVTLSNTIVQGGTYTLTVPINSAQGS